MKIEIEVSDEVAALLATLGPEDQPIDQVVRDVVERLVDHAQQGVYRPGAWERGWLTQAFGDEFTMRLERSDPPYFQRPKRKR